MRPKEKALPLLISNKKIARKFVESFQQISKDLMKKHWPGALTIVFKKSKNVPDFVTGGRDTVAIRMPDDKIALELIEKCGGVLRTFQQQYALFIAESHAKLQSRHG